MKETIPKNYITVSDFMRENKSSNLEYLKLSYYGFIYYRRKGILDDPIRFKGHVEKYYNKKELMGRLFAIHALKTFYGLSLDKIASIIRHEDRLKNKWNISFDELPAWIESTVRKQNVSVFSSKGMEKSFDALNNYISSYYKLLSKKKIS